MDKDSWPSWYVTDAFSFHPCNSSNQGFCFDLLSTAEEVQLIELKVFLIQLKTWVEMYHILEIFHFFSLLLHELGSCVQKSTIHLQRQHSDSQICSLIWQRRCNNLSQGIKQGRSSERKCSLKKKTCRSGAGLPLRRSVFISWFNNRFVI